MAASDRPERRFGDHSAVLGAIRRCAGSDRGGHRAAEHAGRSESTSLLGQPGVRRLRHVLRRVADAGGAPGGPVRPPAHHHCQSRRVRPGGTAGRGRRLGRAADSGPLPARRGRGRVGALGAAAAHHPHRRRAAALAAAVLRSVPRDRGPAPARSLNAVAAIAFTAATMAVVVGTTLIAQPDRRAAGIAIVLLAAPLTAMFIKVDRRAAAPLLPGAVLRIPPLRRGALGAFLNTATTSSAMTLATLYLQGTLHHSPLQAAAMLLPFSLAVVAGSALAAPTLHWIRPQPA